MKLKPIFEEEEIKRLKELRDLLIEIDDKQIVGCVDLAVDYFSEFYPCLYGLLVESLGGIIDEIEKIIN